MAQRQRAAKLNRMRIVSWNCNGAFRRKFHLLEDLEPDVVVIQECENPDLYQNAFADWANNFLWAGMT